MTDPVRAGSTKPAPRRKRLSKKALRIWAWILGAIAFVAPWVAFGVQPKPVVGAASLPRPPTQPRVAQRVLRRVVYSAPKPTQTPRVRYTYSPLPRSAGRNGGGGSSAGGNGGGGGGGGGTIATTGGS